MWPIPFHKTKIIEKWTIYYCLTISITHLNYRRRKNLNSRSKNIESESIEHCHSYCFICNHTLTQQKRLTTVSNDMGIKKSTIAHSHTTYTFVIVHFKRIWKMPNAMSILLVRWGEGSSWNGRLQTHKSMHCIHEASIVKSSMVLYTAFVLNWFFQRWLKNYSNEIQKDNYSTFYAYHDILH